MKTKSLCFVAGNVQIEMKRRIKKNGLISDIGKHENEAIIAKIVSEGHVLFGKYVIVNKYLVKSMKAYGQELNFIKEYDIIAEYIQDDTEEFIDYMEYDTTGMDYGNNEYGTPDVVDLRHKTKMFVS